MGASLGTSQTAAVGEASVPDDAAEPVADPGERWRHPGHSVIVAAHSTEGAHMASVHMRSDAATDDLDWNESIEGVAIGSQVSLIFVYSSRDGAGPRLHQHPYTETFVVRHGRALFTVGDERLEASGGQVLVVPSFTPHKFAVIGPDPFVSTNIHASATFETEWLE